MATSKTFTFNSLPKNVEELKAMPESACTDPFAVAALTVAILCNYQSSANDTYDMLDAIKGPQPLSTYDKQFIKDRMSYGKYVPVSYFAGTNPENSYTPSQPYTITVSDNPYSYQDPAYAVLYLTSSGADSPRQIKLRKKGNNWFLWEQFVLVGIRDAKADDPWA